VKDASGAVVSNAHVVVRGTTLVGDKSLDTDQTGYYRFSDLAAGTYSGQGSGKGFKNVEPQGNGLEAGHLPTLDIMMEVGTASEVIEVSGQAPVVDPCRLTARTPSRAMCISPCLGEV